VSHYSSHYTSLSRFMLLGPTASTQQWVMACCRMSAGGFIPADSLKATATVDQDVTFEYTWQACTALVTMFHIGILTSRKGLHHILMSTS
jgi:hypothetical protein